MLDVNPDTRSTASQVLHSPWIMVWSVADDWLMTYLRPVDNSFLTTYRIQSDNFWVTNTSVVRSWTPRVSPCHNYKFYVGRNLWDILGGKRQTNERTNGQTDGHRCCLKPPVVGLNNILVSKSNLKKSIYIAHRRETSNALNASVRCEQKRLQRLSETVPANNWIPQAVRQGIPDRRTSHTESPSAIKAESVARYDQELLGGGSQILPWCDTCD